MQSLVPKILDDYADHKYSLQQLLNNAHMDEEFHVLLSNWSSR